MTKRLDLGGMTVGYIDGQMLLAGHELQGFATAGGPALRLSVITILIFS
jgi:hypothetical protein